MPPAAAPQYSFLGPLPEAMSTPVRAVVYLIRTAELVACVAISVIVTPPIFTWAYSAVSWLAVPTVCMYALPITIIGCMGALLPIALTDRAITALATATSS